MLDYNSFVRHKLEYMPMRQFAKQIGASPLTVARWRDGAAISFKYRAILDELERQENRRFYEAVTKENEDIQTR